MQSFVILAYMQHILASTEKLIISLFSLKMYLVRQFLTNFFNFFFKMFLIKKGTKLGADFIYKFLLRQKIEFKKY